MQNINNRLRADMLLLLVAIIWGSAFSAQRVAAGNFGFFLFNGLRFLLGALTVLIFLRGRDLKFTSEELMGGSLAGIVLISAATLQHAGLRFTTAGKAGFITGLYVVLVPLFLTVFWHKIPTPNAWFASLLAVAGMFLLSMDGSSRMGLGDGLELAGAVMWAFHVIIIGFLAKKTNGLRLAFVQYVVCGFLGTVTGLLLEFNTLSGLPEVWWAVMYTGVVSVGLGYTLQVIGQQYAPETDSAIILSLESVFAALFGWIFLKELLSTQQIFGCLLLLSAMLLAQWSSFQEQKALRAA